MSGKKCKHCGSSDIEVDPARGDAVCTNCGSVLEDNIIVAEIEFQENAHGGASTIGQFVSAESKGGATGFGRAFNAGIGQESREVTLRKAREGITALCQQLRLNQQCIDIACNFYKMALSRHLTIGRPSSHTQAACVYMTCRTEGTAHLLIDVSDAVPICCYQVGRTYFKLSRALCINIPPTDPCLYILRFSSQLQFNEKSHEVSMTALRLVQRMKRDSIHSGRRPSGICGAALLIAARLHEFNRTPADVVRIVKVHESTLRKRLLEFGDTPSSALTLEEFMTVDLEEEQDPPAFRAARKRDKERLQKLMEEEDGEKELTELQKEIEHQLEKEGNKRKKVAAVIGTSTAVLGIDETTSEDAEASRFAAEDALDLIGEIAQNVQDKEDGRSENLKHEKGLGPDLAVIGLAGGPSQEDKSDKFLRPEPKQATKDLHNADELILDQKDEDYINTLIMNEEEIKHKARLWNKMNAGYLRDQKIKEELRAKEREENKDKKKKLRGSYKKRTPCNAATAGEAIEKMIAEKKISSKINYDILKSLDHPGTPLPPATPKETVVVENNKPPTPSVAVPASPVPRKRKKKNPPPASPAPGPRTPGPMAPPTPQAVTGKSPVAVPASPVPRKRKKKNPPPASPAPGPRTPGPMAPPTPQAVTGKSPVAVPASPVPRKRKKKNPPPASPAPGPRTPGPMAPPTPQAVTGKSPVAVPASPVPRKRKKKNPPPASPAPGPRTPGPMAPPTPQAVTGKSPVAVPASPVPRKRKKKNPPPASPAPGPRTPGPMAPPTPQAVTGKSPVAVPASPVPRKRKKKNPPPASPAPGPRTPGPMAPPTPQAVTGKSPVAVPASPVPRKRKKKNPPPASPAPGPRTPGPMAPPTPQAVTGKSPVAVPASPVPRKRKKKNPPPASPAPGPRTPGPMAPPTPQAVTGKSPVAVPASPVPRKRKKKNPPPASPAPGPRTPGPMAPPTPQAVTEIIDDYEDEIEPDPVDVTGELSLAAMLQNGRDDDYYDYEEY